MPATLTLIFAAYIGGLLITLLVAGQLSDRLGRKPILIPGLLSAIVACVLFATASSIVMLGMARLLTGVAVGVIVSAGMAAVVDMGGTEGKRRASLGASGGYIPAGLLPVATGYLIDVVGLVAGATAFATVLAIAAALGGVFVFKRLHRD